MTDEFAQYKASNYNKSTPKESDDEFAQYKSSNYKPNGEEQRLEQLSKQHPYLLKLAELLQGTPGLEKAGNLAGKFNLGVEKTGLPSLAKGFLGSGVEMGRGLTNLIPGVNVPESQYPELNVHPKFGKGFEIAGSFGMGYPAIKGYQAAKSGLELLPNAQYLPQLIKNILAGGATGAAISPEHRKIGAGLGAGAELLPAVAGKAADIYEKYSPKQKMKQYLESLLSHEREANELGALQNESKEQFKTAEPHKLLQSASEKEKELTGSMAFQKNRIGELQPLPGRQFAKEIEPQIHQTQEQLKHVLGEGEPHTHKLSKHIVEAIEGTPVTEPHPKTGLPRVVNKGGLREEIGHKYDALEHNLPDVKIPHSVDTQVIEKEMKQLIGNRADISEEEKESLKKMLVSTHPKGKEKEINGREFFRAYRSLRQLEGKERTKSFGLSPKDHDEWQARANATKKTYEDMENIINKHFPEDTIKKLHEINHQYANLVAPLHQNPIYQQMLKHGHYKGDLITALSGTTEGNPILNKMIQGNPELSRLTLGHEFAYQPEKLLKPNELLEPYTKAHPEIASLMKKQKELKTHLGEAKEKEQLFKHIEGLPALQRDIAKQRSLADEIKTQLERTDLSKAERTKNKFALDEAERKANKLTKRILKSTLGIGLAGYIGKKLFE